MNHIFKVEGSLMSKSVSARKDVGHFIISLQNEVDFVSPTVDKYRVTVESQTAMNTQIW